MTAGSRAESTSSTSREGTGDVTAEFGRLALHTWTIDTTPLGPALEAIRLAGYDAAELRRTDFKRCYEAGMTNEQVLELVRSSGVTVGVLGVEYGWLFATGAESRRIFADFRVSCENAVALGCPQLMSAPGPYGGSLKAAVGHLRTAADIAAEHALKLSIEFNSQHDDLNSVGTLRDVVQNHLLQLMALVAMEEPTSFEAEALRIEKQKILRSVTLPRRLDLTTARGQYAAGWAGGEKVAGFLEEEGIRKTSTTETFAAVTLNIETRRWAGVPFYLRTGKRLGRRVTEVAVVFKRAPHLPFSASSTEELTQNALVIRIQPDEGMTLRFGSKVPGTAMEIRDVNMDFAYGGTFTEASPEAYERLVLDVLLGDPPLFPRHEEVELSWQILDPILEHWAKKGTPESYASGTWGPEGADKMLARDGRAWRRP